MQPPASLQGYDTSIVKIEPGHIHFELSASPLHPYDSPSVKVDFCPPLHQAASLLQHSPVAIPTETVYGLAADARSDVLVSQIFKAKQRPADNPLIVHVASLCQLRKLTTIPGIYDPLIAEFWPGPLTLLLPASSKLSSLVSKDLDTIAVRMPSHPVALALMLLTDTPLAAPSANTSSRPSPTCARHVLDDLHGRIPLILDGGECQLGLESTVINALTCPPLILRPGMITLHQIQAVGGIYAQTVHYTGSSPTKPLTPGMKYRHYSPSIPLYLFNATTEEFAESHLPAEIPSTAVIGIVTTLFWSIHKFHRKNYIHLSMGLNLEDISRNLFKTLREMELLNVYAIIVEGVDDSLGGAAIMNRLRKAATKSFP